DRPVPLGAIVRNIDGSYFSNYGRVQFAYSPSFGKYHEIHAIAGLEVKDHRLKSKSHRVYGYNISDASHIPVDYLENFPLYYSGRNSRIPEEGGSRFAIDRFRSIFFNASYIYDGRYVVSASARRDESNIFGVSANQKGVPLWSAGLLWNIHREGFYYLYWLPVIKLRTSFGYNGNVDRSTSAYPTAQNYVFVNPWNAASATIVNPPNTSLRL